MEYRIAICDDEQSQLQNLTKILSLYAETHQVKFHIDTYLSAEAFLFDNEDGKAYDILLLDVEMGKMTGVELAKNIRESNNIVQIIFITGFPDYISEGYEVSALHYLMKPVSIEKLHAVLDKAVTNLAKAEKRLCITFDRQVDYVPLNQIMYIEAQKQYVLIYTESKTYRMKVSLTDIGMQLDEYFFKCQRSFIVNLRNVVRINSEQVTLKNGVKVPISRGIAEKIGKEIIRLF